MHGFLEYLKEKFGVRVDPAVARQRRLQKLNAKMSSADPAEQQALSQEKQQLVRDMQDKKTAALHRMLKKRK